MFPEYSRNILQISVSKIFQGQPRNNIFRSQKVQKIVLWVPVKILILAVSSLVMFFRTLLTLFYIWSNVLKRFASILDSW